MVRGTTESSLISKITIAVRIIEVIGHFQKARGRPRKVAESASQTQKSIDLHPSTLSEKIYCPP